MNTLLFIAQIEPARGTNSVSGNTNSATMDWGTVIDLHFENGELIFKMGPILLGAFLISLLGFVAWKLWFREKLLPDFEIVEAELSIAKLGKIKIKPNHENVQISHQAWVELTTRKAALPFENDHDVVVEVYDSYYQLFTQLRDLTKNISAAKLRKCPDTRKLVEVMVKVLNQGLRPHLTRWQARFRRWYDDALKDPSNRGKSPQEIQKGFPDYTALVNDLKELQTSIVKYGEFLREIAQGKGD